MRRDLDAVRSALFDWAGADGFDATLAGRLEQPRKDEDFYCALILRHTFSFHKAIAHFDYALETGSAEAVNTALLFLDQGILTAAEFEAVPFWWVFTIARHLIDDLRKRVCTHVCRIQSTMNPARNGPISKAFYC